MIYTILDGKPELNLENTSQLQMIDAVIQRNFKFLRGVKIDGYFTSALFGKVLDNNYCTLLLVGKEGETLTGSEHRHLTHLDQNFNAYKELLGVEGFYICPVNSSRTSLIEKRFPLWERRGNAQHSGEPLFVREV